MTNLQNTETTKKQLSLFKPFFDKELTCTNEFMTYIDCDISNQNIVHNNSAVTSDVKITSASNNTKYLLSLRLKLRTTREYHKALKIHNKYQIEDIKRYRQMFKDIKQKISA